MSLDMVFSHCQNLVKHEGMTNHLNEIHLQQPILFCFPMELEELRVVNSEQSGLMNTYAGHYNIMMAGFEPIILFPSSASVSRKSGMHCYLLASK